MYHQTDSQHFVDDCEEEKEKDVSKVTPGNGSVQTVSVDGRKPSILTVTHSNGQPIAELSRSGYGLADFEHLCNELRERGELKTSERHLFYGILLEGTQNERFQRKRELQKKSLLEKELNAHIQNHEGG